MIKYEEVIGMGILFYKDMKRENPLLNKDLFENEFNKQMSSIAKKLAFKISDVSPSKKYSDIYSEILSELKQRKKYFINSIWEQSTKIRWFTSGDFSGLPTV